MTARFIKTHSHFTGVSYARVEDLYLRLVVLPKAWSPYRSLRQKGQTVRRVCRWPEQTQIASLILFENEEIKLLLDEGEISSDQLHQRISVLDKLLSSAQLQMQARGTEQPGDSTLSREATPLISACASFPLSTEIISASIQHQSQTDPLSPPAHLASDELDLLQLCLRVWEDPAMRFVKGKQGVGYHPVTTPIIYALFVKEVRTLFRSLRRQYLPRTARVSRVRGQIDIQDLALSEESGRAEILCHFDELDRDTPLLKVLVSTLHIVAQGHPFSQLFTSLLPSSGEARQLLSRFTQVFPLHRIQALKLAQRIHLGRKLRAFERALTYARLILAQLSPHQHQSRLEESDTWCFEVDMSDLWERILYRSLSSLDEARVLYYDKKLGDHSLYPQRIPSPFAHALSKGSDPDILAQISSFQGTTNWIIDAKYSLRSSYRQSPFGQHSDQMFRYLYVMQNEGKPWAQRLALIYTTPQNVLSTLPSTLPSGSPTQGVWLPEWGPPASLHQHIAPFPNPQDTRHPDQWDAYQSKLNLSLAELLTSC